MFRKMRQSGPPLVRVTNILKHIVEQEVPPTLAELSRGIQLPKPTVHRLAAALERVGLIRKDPLTRRYQAGGGLEALAFGVIRAGVGHGSRRFHMQKLSDKVGERVNLGVLSADKEPHVAWADTVSPLREGTKLDVDPGLRLPLHCTANGKLLLAYAAPAFRRRVLEAAPYRAYTKNTVTSPSGLFAELQRIRERGFAEDDEEFLDGAICLAVPVRNRRGQALAGLAIMAPTARLSLDKARGYLSELRECAESISRELGWTPAAASAGDNG